MTYAKKVLLCFAVAIIFLLALVLSYFFISFKTEFDDCVTLASNQFGVDKSLIFSIIKAESKFNKNAKSPKGAIGLMQVKLSTANYMFEKNNTEFEFLSNKTLLFENDLLDPKTNIMIGTKYIKYLLDKFDNVDVSICAYNAGETVVRGWLQNKEYSKDGKTLLKIPYVETDRYLNRVKFNQFFYKKIL